MDGCILIVDVLGDYQVCWGFYKDVMSLENSSFAFLMQNFSLFLVVENFYYSLSSNFTGQRNMNGLFASTWSQIRFLKAFMVLVMY